MSQLEKNKNSVLVIPVTCANGVSNVVTSTTIPALSGATKLLSVVRLTPAGAVVGVPSVRLFQPTGSVAGAVYGIGVFSSSNQDNSVYNIYLMKEYNPSPEFIQGTATTLGAGVQYAP
jgi:hypothetical protein